RPDRLGRWSHLFGTIRSSGSGSESRAVHIGNVCRRIYHPRLAAPSIILKSHYYGCTGGSVLEPDVLRHVGCPNPPALIPVPPLGLSFISKMMLSGRAASPETPPTPLKWSKPRLFRTRQAML